MTVAAVVLAPPPVAALMDGAGRPLVRGIADAALAGGALPIVVVSSDPDGRLAAGLAGSEAIVTSPGSAEPGVAWFADGIVRAAGLVAGTTAALLWPGRHAWVDPETVTSLVEAHGVRPDAILRPTYEGEGGYPVLIPLRHAAALATLGAAGHHGPEAIDRLVADGARIEWLELGDPGTTHDASTPRGSLPPFHGPSAPASGHVHEWGAAAADRSDDPA